MNEVKDQRVVWSSMSTTLAANFSTYFGCGKHCRSRIFTVVIWLIKPQITKFAKNQCSIIMLAACDFCRLVGGVENQVENRIEATDTAEKDLRMVVVPRCIMDTNSLFLNHFFQTRIFYPELITRLLEFICSDIPAPIFIEIRKCSEQMVFFCDLIDMQHGSYELPIVNSATVIHICLKFPGKINIIRTRSAPNLFSPTFSSSNVMFPLPSMSIILNISFSPAISSSDSLSAITCRTSSRDSVTKNHNFVRACKALLASDQNQILTLRAIFLSLFIAENCVKRVKTAESRGLSGATPSTCTQG
nr:Os02g0831900 [Ipomoea batatas]